MKKIILLIAMLSATILSANAQKFALIDMEYILKNIPAYEQGNKKLEQQTQVWQKQIEKATEEAKALYTQYQSKAASLTAAQKSQQEEAIIAKEKEMSELKRKYFGPEGEAVKIRNEFMKPLQDDIYDAVKEISESIGYALVLDRSSAASVIFASPRIDISDEVLNRLGYSN
jgi:outer membrane protein